MITLDKILMLATLAVIAIALLGIWRGGARDEEPAIIPARDICVLCSGWRRHEISQVLASFCDLYALDRHMLRPVEEGDGIVRVATHVGLPAWQIAFLVNYLHYPDGQDLRSSKPTALARLCFTADCPFSLRENHGQTGILYIREGDEAFDEVFAMLDNGESYRLPFGARHWTPHRDARMSSSLRKLAAYAKASSGISSASGANT